MLSGAKVSGVVRFHFVTDAEFAKIERRLLALLLHAQAAALLLLLLLLLLLRLLVARTEREETLHADEGDPGGLLVLR